MNVQNVHPKQVVKSYKELCNLLDEPVKSSDSKKAQLKEWERYFRFHKKENDRYAIVIDEVYDKPLPEKMRVDDIYSALVQVILCDYLRMPEKLVEGAILVTKKQLYEICGMVNRNYIDVSTKNAMLDDFKTKNNLSVQANKWTVNEFNMRVNSRLNNILFKVLNRLKRKKYIIYNDYFEITEVVNGVKVVREATSYESNNYLNACQEIKKKLNITYVNDYNSSDFYAAVKEYIKKEYGWDSCYEYIRINYADNFTQQYYEMSKQELQIEINKNRKAVNDNVIKMFERLIREDYKKNRDKVFELKKDSAPELAVGTLSNLSIELATTDKEITDKHEVKVLRDDYIQLQQQLVDMFIRIISEEEIHDIKNNF